MGGGPLGVAALGQESRRSLVLCGALARWKVRVDGLPDQRVHELERLAIGEPPGRDEEARALEGSGRFFDACQPRRVVDLRRALENRESASESARVGREAL